MDQNVFHKLQLEILNAIDLLLLTMTYGICWYAYYGDEISTPFYDLGNEIMVALFVILYYFISHLYHGLSAASQTLFTARHWQSSLPMP